MIRIVEQSMISRSGILDECEDAIFMSGDFAAVVDGATAKTTTIRDGMTPGRISAQIICAALANVPRDASAMEAATQLTLAIRAYYASHGMVELVQTQSWERLTASIVVLSSARREIWMVGDCQALVAGRVIRNEKPVDRILADARSLCLELAMLEGHSADALREEDGDLGRKFILPLLERQQLLQNGPPSCQYSYGAIDGFDVQESAIKIHRLRPWARQVVLASDGYPELCSTLEESEEMLREVLQDDPLCFRRFRSTKGVVNGDASFDDRTFLKLELG